MQFRILTSLAEQSPNNVGTEATNRPNIDVVGVVKPNEFNGIGKWPLSGPVPTISLLRP